MARICCLSLSPLARSLKVRMSWVSHDLHFLKVCWQSVRMLFLSKWDAILVWMTCFRIFFCRKIALVAYVICLLSGIRALTPLFGIGAEVHGIGKISCVLTKIGKFDIVLMYEVFIARLIQ